MHGLRYAAALEGQKFDQATWVRLKKQVEAELACAARMYALFRRRVAKLNLLTIALTVDVSVATETVVVCGLQCIGRQGAESPTNSVVPQFGEIRGTLKSYEWIS
jgi:hypothetical protein